jgi:hypothetical protein
VVGVAEMFDDGVLVSHTIIISEFL